VALSGLQQEGGAKIVHTTEYTTKEYEVRVHHNGDFSGDVRLKWTHTSGGDAQEADIPFEVIKHLVLYYYHDEKIRRLEGWDTIEELEVVLGLK
jgi:hypothetical protein